MNPIGGGAGGGGAGDGGARDGGAGGGGGHDPTERSYMKLPNYIFRIVRLHPVHYPYTTVPLVCTHAILTPIPSTQI